VRVADLAKALGVSEVTVRRDLSDLVREGRLAKVHGGAVLVRRPPQDRPPAAAGALVIGLVVPASSYYFRRIVDGVRAVLQARTQVRLLLAVSRYDPAGERALAARLVEAGARALLLTPSGDAGWTAGLGVPVVLVERSLPGADGRGVSWVRSAHESGAELAVRHLHDLGHRRIALFTRGDTPTSRSVLAGWEHVAADLGLPAGAELRFSGGSVPTWPRWDREQASALADRLRSAGATALLCHSDEDANELLRNDLAARLGVPRDLSVVAYDDELSARTDPPLTAVSPPKQAVGELAARTLLEIVAHPGAPVRHIEVEPCLRIRASTRPLAAHP
jgi:DNA-binding LacI/PurR family transcriptional regulator